VRLDIRELWCSPAAGRRWQQRPDLRPPTRCKTPRFMLEAHKAQRRGGGNVKARARPSSRRARAPEGCPIKNFFAGFLRPRSHSHPCPRAPSRREAADARAHQVSSSDLVRGPMLQRARVWITWAQPINKSNPHRSTRCVGSSGPIGLRRGQASPRMTPVLDRSNVAPAGAAANELAGAPQRTRNDMRAIGLAPDIIT